MKAPLFARFLFIGLLALVAVVPTSRAFAAKNVVHTTFEITNEVDEFELGPEAECFGGPGTVRTVASGVVKLTEFVDGPNEGNFHVRGRAEGTFEIVTAAGTFTGTFKSTFNEKLNRNNFVASFNVHVTGTDANGEAVKANFHGHVVIMEGETEPQVEFFKVNCVK